MYIRSLCTTLEYGDPYQVARALLTAFQLECIYRGGGGGSKVGMSIPDLFPDPGISGFSGENPGISRDPGIGVFSNIRLT